MPYRRLPLVSGETYHIFNRGVAKQPIFRNQREYQRALETIDFYRFPDLSIRFSYFNRLNQKDKEKFLDALYLSKPQVEIFAFCLMPNHIHFLLRQTKDDGVTKFMRFWQDSFAKYLNTRAERNGPLFESVFKGVRIESEEQFLHVARYIHLNPLTGYLLKSISDLQLYPWCSFADYINRFSRPLVTTEPLDSLFSNPDKFKQFTLDQLDYQRTLDKIKHLIHE